MQGRWIMSRIVHAGWLIFFGMLMSSAPLSEASPSAPPAPIQAAAGESPPGDKPILPESDAADPASAASVVTASLGDPARERAAVSPEPFGLSSSPAPFGAFAAKWAELQSRIQAEQDVLSACRSGQGDCPPAAREFLHIVEVGRQRQGRAQLGEINRTINLRIKPVSDISQYGVEDYWAAPIETLRAGGGDCEDYAIAKYVALQQAGIRPDDVRLVIVRDIKRQAIHAVVAVHRDDEWLILDNRTLMIVDAEASEYEPLLVLDQRGVRVYDQLLEDVAAQPSSRIQSAGQK